MFDDDDFDSIDDQPIAAPKAAQHPNSELPVAERVALGIAGKRPSEGAIVPFPVHLRGADVLAALTGTERRAHEHFVSHGYRCAVFEARDDTDRLLQVVLRYDHDSEPKEIRPLRYCGKGEKGNDLYWLTWIPGTKPLYGWDRLAKRPDAPVIVVEGEKTAEAAAAQFPGHVAVSWLSGAGAVSKADLSPLANRDVTVWPDNDEAGRKAAARLAARALEGGAAKVSTVEVPSQLGENWDLADKMPELSPPVDLAALLSAAKPMNQQDADQILHGARRRANARRLLGYNTGYSRVDPEAVAAALTHLDPDMPGPKWRRVAACIHHAFGSAGLAIFDAWSSGGGKYKDGEPTALWQNFAETAGFEGMPLGWLMRWAVREAKHAVIESAIPLDALLLAEIEELNANHAVIERGSKTVVLRETYDPRANRYAHSYMKKTDFVQQHVRRVELPPEEGSNKIKRVQLGGLWFDSSQRRQYDGLVFAPEGGIGWRQLNLWQGFAVEPTTNPDGWNLLKAHLLANVAQGHLHSYNYLMDWLAAGVQHLHKPAGTALVLVGTKGAGKSIITVLYARLFGPHTFMTGISEDIVGRFNGRLEHTLLLGVEEAFAPQNRGADGTLKDLITRSDLRLEDKFFSTWTAPNRLRIIMTSNSDHVVRADGNDRRYAVFEVANPFAADPVARHAYFGAIAQQMDFGGYEAMLGELLTRDLSGWNPERIPETPALVRQKLHNLGSNPVRAWLHRRLTDGTCIVEGSAPTDPAYHWSEADPVTVPTKDVRADFVAFCRRNGMRGTEAQLSMHLPKLMPEGFASRVIRLNDVDGKVPTRVYDFPPLDAARASFAAATGISDWAEAGGG